MGPLTCTLDSTPFWGCNCSIYSSFMDGVVRVILRGREERVAGRSTKATSFCLLLLGVLLATACASREEALETLPRTSTLPPDDTTSSSTASSEVTSDLPTASRRANAGPRPPTSTTSGATTSTSPGPTTSSARSVTTSTTGSPTSSITTMKTRPIREYPAGGPTDQVSPPGHTAYEFLRDGKCQDLLDAAKTWESNVADVEGQDTIFLYRSAANACLANWKAAKDDFKRLGNPDFSEAGVCKQHARTIVFNWLKELINQHDKDSNFSPVFVKSSKQDLCPSDESNSSSSTTNG